MQAICRIGIFPALAIALSALPALAGTGHADAPVAPRDAALFSSLTPARDLGSITGKAGISGQGIVDNLVQASTTTIKSSVSDVTLGNSDRSLGASSSTAAFTTGSVQGLSFSGLGGANAIAINTGIASNQTQSVTVNLTIGSVGSLSGALARTR